MPDNKYTTIGVKSQDHAVIRYTAWYERMAIADLVPQAVRMFANATPAERAEILARQTQYTSVRPAGV